MRRDTVVAPRTVEPGDKNEYFYFSPIHTHMPA
ncbi:protein of unknown function [uncultured Woeseiaceae bacterium]|uniref:Uncharacterized protein n=1 Tax=uncultured Woeseiaceae bacterium TaxID=1983305 RepID=A0A7D9H4Y8_9GAMM|nr:protein of unknown function [uncultured Woeseiaceae bacterium]